MLGNACPEGIVRAFHMRYSTVLLTLLITVTSYAQKDKLSITFCPLAAADVISFQTIQGGIEYRFTPTFSWYNELGVEFMPSSVDRPDSVILRPHGIKVKTEFRYFFHPGRYSRLRLYVAGNAFLTSDVHNLGIEYAYNGNTDSIRSDAFGVKKLVWGLNAVFGMQREMGKRWTWDFYAGVGIQLRYITTVGEHFVYGRDDLITSIDANIADIRAAAEAKGGFSVWPNVTAGIRLCYRL